MTMAFAQGRRSRGSDSRTARRDQALPGVLAARRVVLAPARIRLRAHRAERRGEDDHRQDDPRPGPSRGRRTAGVRRRSRHGGARRERPDRVRARGAGVLRAPPRGGDRLHRAAVLQPLGPAAVRGAGARVRGADGHVVRFPVARHADESGAGAGARAPCGAAGARRADGRPRPGVPPLAPGTPRRLRRGRARVGPVLDAHHGRPRAHGRLHHVHPRRPPRVLVDARRGLRPVVRREGRPPDAGRFDPAGAGGRRGRPARVHGTDQRSRRRSGSNWRAAKPSSRRRRWRTSCTTRGGHAESVPQRREGRRDLPLGGRPAQHRRRPPGVEIRRRVLLGERHLRRADPGVRCPCSNGRTRRSRSSTACP